MTGPDQRGRYTTAQAEISEVSRGPAWRVAVALTNCPAGTAVVPEKRKSARPFASVSTVVAPRYARASHEPGQHDHGLEYTSMANGVFGRLHNSPRTVVAAPSVDA